MLRGTSRLLVLDESATMRWLRTIAARIPLQGISGSQMQALVEDEFPAFSPAAVNAQTLKEVMLDFPQLFTVVENQQLPAKWHVRPNHVHDTAAEVASLSSSTSASDKALQEVQRYCARRAEHGRTSYVSLDRVLARAGVTDLSVVDEVLRNAQSGLDVQVGVRIKPKRLPRAITAFVDGDALPAIAVDAMCNELNVMKESSHVTIVRQPGTSPLSEADMLCPEVIPTYLYIEKQARELRLRRPDVRTDVVYMCAASQFATYAEHVARLNAFPDADVYVCCPSKVTLVQPKTVVSLE